MKILLLSLNFFLILFLSSCAPQKGTSKLKISVAAVTGSAQFPGGLFVLGQHEVTKQRIIRKVGTADSIELELENGRWDFSAMGWDGSEHFEGNVFCDLLSNIDLDGKNIPLNFNTSKAKCGVPVFGAQPDGANQFHPLTFHTCMDIQHYILDPETTIPANMSCGAGNPQLFDGGMKSFRITFHEIFDNGSTSPGLFSKCYNTSDAKADTGIKLPFGSSLFSLKYLVKGFSDSSCAGAETLYKLPNGFYSPVEESLGVVLQDSGKVNLLLHANACEGSHLTNAPFAAGSTASGSYLVCTKAQFEQIANTSTCTATTAGLPSMGCERDASYQLGKNIEFGGSNTTISGVFNGDFDGRDKILSGGNAPLFDIIEPGSISDNRINSLTIDSFVITKNSFSATENFGFLAKTVQSQSTSNKLEISDITINFNSSISINSNGAGNEIFAGALIGEINFNSNNTGDELFIRNVHSLANILATDSATTIFNIGGLVGRARGNNSNGQVALEINSVGLIDQMNRDNTNGRVLLASDQKIGGLIGQSRDIDIREGNVAITDISADAYIGGIVGDAQDETQITSTYADVNAFAIATDVNRVGGIIGDVPSGVHNIYINSVIAKLKINDSTNAFSQVGGIIGSASGVSTGNFIISDAKAVLDIRSDGTYQGGIIGKYIDSNFSNSDSPFIVNSIAEGDIKLVNSGSGSNRRGGLVGSITNGKVERSIANFNQIHGDQKIAGAFGEGFNSYFKEGYIKILDLKAYHGSSPQSAGVVGAWYDNGNDFTFFEYIKLDVNASYPGVGNSCDGSNGCGSIVGDITGTPSGVGHFDNILHLSNFSGTQCGNSGYCSGQVTFEKSSAANCSGFGGPYDDSSGVCEPTFKRRWSEFSERHTNVSSGQFLAGNNIEPFPLYVFSDWNEIEHDDFLNSKFFELKNHLYFNGQAFKALGGDDNANEPTFSGGIISNGFALHDITFTTTTNILGGSQLSGGLIPMLKNGRVGTRGEPLYIDGLNLTCTVGKCGVVGSSENGKIFVVVKDGNITSTGSPIGIGGILGMAAVGDTEISNSGFQGSINVPTSDKVGGLVGHNGISSGIRIDDSFAKLNLIKGQNNVGGILGFGQSTSQTIKIEKSYVWIDTNAQNSGNDDFAGSTYLGGIVGKLIEPSSTIDDVYIDVSLAQVGSGFKTIASGGGTLSGSPTLVVVGAGANTIGTPVFEANQFDVYTNYFSNENDWVIDSNQNLVLDWEVNGFNN